MRNPLGHKFVWEIFGLVGVDEREPGCMISWVDVDWVMSPFGNHLVCFFLFDEGRMYSVCYQIFVSLIRCLFIYIGVSVLT